MKRGFVTESIARNCDLTTIIHNCQVAEFQGVKLRATRGVEPDLDAPPRKEGRQRFSDTGMTL